MSICISVYVYGFVGVRKVVYVYLCVKVCVCVCVYMKKVLIVHSVSECILGVCVSVCVP